MELVAEVVDLQELLYYSVLFVSCAMGFSKGGQR